MTIRNGKDEMKMKNKIKIKRNRNRNQNQKMKNENEKMKRPKRTISQTMMPRSILYFTLLSYEIDWMDINFIIVKFSIFNKHYRLYLFK